MKNLECYNCDNGDIEVYKSSIENYWQAVRYEGYVRYYWVVDCLNCGAYVYGKTKRQAIRKWKKTRTHTTEDI